MINPLYFMINSFFHHRLKRSFHIVATVFCLMTFFSNLQIFAAEEMPDFSEVIGLNVVVENSKNCGGSNSNAQTVTAVGQIKGLKPDGCPIKIAVTVTGLVERQNAPFDYVYVNDVLFFSGNEEHAGCPMTSKTETKEITIDPSKTASLTLKYDTSDGLYHVGAFATITDVQLVSDGCSSGNCSGDSGSGGASMSGAEGFININMGYGANGGSMGSMKILFDLPSADLATPAALQYAHSKAEILKDANDVIQQIKTPQSLVNIVVMNDKKYEVHFYSLDGIAGQNTLPYQPTGAPTIIWIIENPDATGATTNRLKVTQIYGATTKISEYEYDEATATWSLISGNGAKKETTSESWDAAGVNRTVDYIVKNAQNAVVYKRRDLYHTFPWGEEQMQSIEDPDGVTLTTTYSYYDNQTADGNNYGRVKQIVSPTGFWKRYYYDNVGRIIKTVSQYKDAPTGSAESLNRVNTIIYSTSSPQEQQEEKLLGRVISKSYTDVSFNGSMHTTRREQCQQANAYWYGANNLAETSVVYGSGAFTGEIQSVTSSDGAQIQYAYQLNADGSITTTQTVPMGIRTVTTKNAMGKTVSVMVKDSSNRILSTANATQIDALGRNTRIEYDDGTYETMTYSCCGLESKRDRFGMTTSYTYDDFNRIQTETTDGITLLYEYDSMGNQTKVTRQGTDGSSVVMSQAFYDVAGRLWKTVDALNHATLYSIGVNVSGQTVKTTTYPDGTTRVETHHQDGQLLSIAGSSVAPMKYEHGVDNDGVFRKEIKVGVNGAETEWTTTWTNMIGSIGKVASSGGAVTNYSYNNKGQLVKMVDPDGVTTLYAYNATTGAQETQAIDVNRNGNIDFNGTDRIIQSTKTIVSHTNNRALYCTTAKLWNQDNANATVESVVKTNAAGTESWSTDYNGLTTHTLATFNGNGTRTVSTTHPDGSVDEQIYAGNRLMSQKRRDANGNQIAGQTREYDAHGRVTRVADARNGTTQYTYYDNDLPHTVTTPAPDAASPAQTTSYTYDAMGRTLTVTQTDGGVVNYQYWPTGALKQTSGARTYTASYGYDSQGRTTSLVTATGTTLWNYSAMTGLLTAKTYADGKSTNYAYTAGQRLQSRTWARGVVTTYGYNNAGEQNSVTYSDNTQAVTVQYNRLGQIASVTDAVGTRTLTYRADGQPNTEAFTGGLFNGLSLAHGYNALALRNAFRIQTTTGTAVSQSYGYDAASRLNSASQGNVTATYGYAPNSSLIVSVSIQNNTATLTTGKTYDKLNRLTNINTRVSSIPVNSYGYRYNAADQRTRVDWQDGSHIDYGYDALGQVTAAQRYWADQSLVAGQQYGYQYDGIGNRLASITNGRTASYTPNALNQYLSREVPGMVDVLGSADPDATVTVNSRPTTRQQGGYFAGQVSVENAANSVDVPIRVTGVKNRVGSNGEDAVTVSEGKVFVPKTPEQYTYDADGNLTSDGRWNYTWDGENRLIGMEAKTNVPVSAKQKLTFNYDYGSRRVEQKIYQWDETTASYETTASSITRFLYDGWNLIAEMNSGNVITKSYLWGMDLSGSPQGAGGVGGLLALTVTGSNQQSYAYAYDGNGNVTDLTDENGNNVAHYEYSPFGELVSLNGTMANLNSFRFSTKYTDDETELVYYGYRYYNPNTGRWINRDPIEEDGGTNMYGMVKNQLINMVDLFGLKWSSPNRKGDAWAEIQGECGDKVEELAKKLGFEASEFNKWLKLKKGAMPSSHTKPLSVASTFEVPNIIAVYTSKRTGIDLFTDMTSANMAREGAIMSGRQFMSMGYKVLFKNNYNSKATFVSLWNTSGIAGIVYGGHGEANGAGLLVEKNNPVNPSEVNPAYRLSYLYLWFKTRLERKFS